VSIGTILADPHTSIFFWSRNLGYLENVCFCFRSTPTDELAAFLPNWRDATIDLSAPQGSDIRGKHRLSAGTFGSAFIIVLLGLNLAAILKTWDFRSTPRELIELSAFLPISHTGTDEFDIKCI
jgi:hypothetical protein